MREGCSLLAKDIAVRLRPGNYKVARKQARVGKIGIASTQRRPKCRQSMEFCKGQMRGITRACLPACPQSAYAATAGFCIGQFISRSVCCGSVEPMRLQSLVINSATLHRNAPSLYARLFYLGTVKKFINYSVYISFVLSFRSFLPTFCSSDRTIFPLAMNAPEPIRFVSLTEPLYSEVCHGRKVWREKSFACSFVSM